MGEKCKKMAKLYATPDRRWGKNTKNWEKSVWKTGNKIILWRKEILKKLTKREFRSARLTGKSGKKASKLHKDLVIIFLS